MKSTWIWIIVIVLVGVFGYMYRSQIKSMFSVGYTSPASTTGYIPTSASPPASPTGDVLSWKGTAGSQYAVALNGMTLYIFDKDSKGVSNCYGTCAVNWPPYSSVGAKADFPTNVTLITRTDGSAQFAFKGMPVYFYAGDQKAGDTNGDGVGGTWHLVRP